MRKFRFKIVKLRQILARKRIKKQQKAEGDFRLPLTNIYVKMRLRFARGSLKRLKRYEDDVVRRFQAAFNARRQAITFILRFKRQPETFAIIGQALMPDVF